MKSRQVFSLHKTPVLLEELFEGALHIKTPTYETKKIAKDRNAKKIKRNGLDG